VCERTITAESYQKVNNMQLWISDFGLAVGTLVALRGLVSRSRLKGWKVEVGHLFYKSLWSTVVDKMINTKINWSASRLTLWGVLFSRQLRRNNALTFPGAAAILQSLRVAGVVAWRLYNRRPTRRHVANMAALPTSKNTDSYNIAEQFRQRPC